MITENQQPLSTQGDTGEKEDQLGGSTNLPLDALNQQGGVPSPSENNTSDLEDNQGDLNEIRAADDLDEPDLDDYQPDEDDDELDEADLGSYDTDTDNEDEELDDTGLGGYDADTDEEDNDSLIAELSGSSQNRSANDTDGNGGYPDMVATQHNL